MARIYTRTGDDGTAGLFGGQRVRKDSPRLWAYGTVDELNSLLGLARAHHPSLRLDAILASIQNDLFVLGAELASPGAEVARVQPGQIAALERWIDELESELTPLTNFILPGGSVLGATLHVARTTCRRAERHCVRLAAADPVNPQTIAYLNRLSDALFVLARWANHQAGLAETPWPNPAN